MNSPLSYRPEIDGLRAVAVVSVILFHLGFEWINGGFAGVDVFFVISGFLITSIIVREHQKGTFTLRSFWVRRARRILPALLSVIFVTLCLAYAVGYRNELEIYGRQSLAAMFSVANIALWLSTGNYWGSAAENSPFLHCWSLSVEEQFYVLYPLMLIACLRKGERYAVGLIVIVLVGSLVVFLYAYSRIPMAAFYLLPFRAWELAAGCLIGMPSVQRYLLLLPRPLARLAQLAGLALIVFSFFRIRGGGINWHIMLPVVGSCLFIAFGDKRGLSARLLSTPPFVQVGRISYSLYLWHWPVIVLFSTFAPFFSSTHFGLLAQIAIVVGLSAISYVVIESPMRKPTAALFPIGIASVACFGAAVIYLVRHNWQSYDTSRFNEVSFHGHAYDVAPKNDEWDDTKSRKMAGVNARKRDPEHSNAFRSEGIIQRYGGQHTSILVLGDSHAGMWSSLIDEVAKDMQVSVSFLSAAGVSPFVELPVHLRRPALGFTAEEKFEFDRTRLRCVASWRPIVILSVRWSTYGYNKAMRDLVEYIGAQGCSIILVEQPPEIGSKDRNTAQYFSYLGLEPLNEEPMLFPQTNVANVERGRGIVRRLAKDYPFCSILETRDLYESEFSDVVVAAGRNIVYYDDDHLSAFGASMAKERFIDAIELHRPRLAARLGAFK